MENINIEDFKVKTANKLANFATKLNTEEYRIQLKKM
jgi:hypothetical protein